MESTVSNSSAVLPNVAVIGSLKKSHATNRTPKLSSTTIGHEATIIIEEGESYG